MAVDRYRGLVLGGLGVLVMIVVVVAGVRLGGGNNIAVDGDALNAAAAGDSSTAHNDADEAGGQAEADDVDTSMQTESRDSGFSNSGADNRGDSSDESTTKNTLRVTTSQSPSKLTASTTTSSSTSTTMATTSSEAPTSTTAAPSTKPTEPEAPTTKPTPAPTEAPAPNPAPASGDRGLESRVIDLTNAERKAKGCPALASNGKLHAAALAHSADMARNNYFSHTGRDGSSMSDRINRQGYSWRRLAENIAAGYRTPESVVKGWMNSAGHRANILNCDLTEIGVGFHDHYWTQNFGTPRRGSAPAPTTAPPTTRPPTTPSTTVTTAAPTTAPPTTKPAPTTAPPPGGDSGDRALERRVIDLTNAERKANGCPPLTHNSKLHAAALAHSTDMAKNNYFSHTSRDGSSMSDRIERQGYAWRRLAENIAAGYRTPESVVDGWMNSPGHRANILNCDLTEIGVGFHDYYWTQNFGTPR